MKKYTIKFYDGDDYYVSKLCLKSDLSRDELQKSIVMDESEVIVNGTDKIDDCYSIRVEENA